MLLLYAALESMLLLIQAVLGLTRPSFRELEQKNLIDAAITTGVQRFLPASFAGDLTDPLDRALNFNKDKVAIDNYLRQHESRISQTSINTGPLLDFVLARGVLINMKVRSITLYDSGDKRISTTTIPTASAAVVAVLKMGDASKNRAFFVQDIVTTQNELFNLAKEILPDAEWSVNHVSTADLVGKVNEAYRADPNSTMGRILEKAVAVFGPGRVTDFGTADNAELGIRMMDKGQLKDLLKTFA